MASRSMTAKEFFFYFPGYYYFSTGYFCCKKSDTMRLKLPALG